MAKDQTFRPVNLPLCSTLIPIGGAISQYRQDIVIDILVPYSPALREEELERKQMEMRRQAMMNANEEPISEMSLEDAARKKLMDEVIRVSHERPDDVAQLLRTWMADDKS